MSEQTTNSVEVKDEYDLASAVANIMGPSSAAAMAIDCYHQHKDAGRKPCIVKVKGQWRVYHGYAPTEYEHD